MRIHALIFKDKYNEYAFFVFVFLTLKYDLIYT